jgi:hypothetical protein
MKAGGFLALPINRRTDTMAEFILDTSGHVETPPAHFVRTADAVWRWECLDDFTQGCIEALFFTECEPGTDVESHDPETESALHGECGFSDLAPETLARIIDDCSRFQARAAGLLALAYETDYDAASAGRDFWFARNGHGAGFWERVALEIDVDDESLWIEASESRSIGDNLSALCGWTTDFDNVHVFLGDDGKVYLS